MKTKILWGICMVASVVLSSCKKDKAVDDDVVTATTAVIQRIASVKTYQNDKLLYLNTYKYDATDRLITHAEYSYDDNGNEDDRDENTYTYSGSQVTDGELKWTLDANGLALKAIDLSDGSTYYTCIYNNGYMNTATWPGSYSTTDAFTWQDDNLAKVIETHTYTPTSSASSKAAAVNGHRSLPLGLLHRVFSELTTGKNRPNKASAISAVGSNSVISYTYTYYMDKYNTIAAGSWGGEDLNFVNIGLSFLGKGSKNLVKTLTTTDSSGSTTITYSYEYDSRGRVTAQTWTKDGDTWKKIYTYVK